MKYLNLVFLGFLMCGCSTPHVLPQHHGVSLCLPEKKALLQQAADPVKLDFKKGDEVVLVYAGECVSQPFGGCIDYATGDITGIEASYSMNKPGLVLYEMIVDELRKRGCSVSRMYSTRPVLSEGKKELMLKVNEMEVYAIRKKKNLHVVAYASVLCRMSQSEEWKNQVVLVDVPFSQDVFDEMARSFVNQIFQ